MAPGLFAFLLSKSMRHVSVSRANRESKLFFRVAESLFFGFFGSLTCRLGAELRSFRPHT